MSDLKNSDQNGQQLDNQVDSLYLEQNSQAALSSPKPILVETERVPTVEKPASAKKDPQASKQFAAGKQLVLLGGISATDRLLGLDLRPTATGVLAPPPGNQEFLRHISTANRRTLMRKLLNKQRDRMRRLAGFLRDQKDENESGGESDRQSFLEVISESMELDRSQIQRAANELDKTARMLDILDEMLSMQDYTFSQMGNFTHG